MKYKTMEAEKVEKLPFVKNAVFNNGCLKNIEIEVDGESYFIGERYGDLYMSAKEPDKFESRCIVSGTILDNKIQDKVFETEVDADKFISSVKVDDADKDLQKEVVEYNVTKNGSEFEPTSDYPF